MFIELGLIISAVGILTFMASKNKSNPISLGNLDLDLFVDKLAKAIGKEIAKQISTQSFSRAPVVSKESSSALIIDESIIPMKIEISTLENNISTKEETKVDKTISNVKAKLATFKKGK